MGASFLTANQKQSVRLLLAAVYPARAAVELMRECARQRYLRVTSAELDQMLRDSVPFVRLVHVLRIYDFHRIGLRHQAGMPFHCEIKIPPQTSWTLSLGPLACHIFEVTNRCGSAHRAETFLWAPPFAQAVGGEPPVHIGVALADYLRALERFLPEFEAL